MKKNLIVGITAGYELGPNELRELILCDNYKSKYPNSRVILINDDIDPLTQRHIKLINKEFPNLNYQNYLGTPLYLIPSPKNNTKSLSDYYLDLYLKKAKKLGIVPDIISNSSEIRRTEKFKLIFNQIIKNKDNIITFINDKYKLDYSNKFIKYLDNNLNYSNKFRNNNNNNNNNNNLFKFPWSIECLIRWVYYNADIEFFAKNYLTKPNGSYYISSDICKLFMNVNPPKAIQYEFVRYFKEIQMIFDILPAKLFKKLMCNSVLSSTHINKNEMLNLLKNEILINKKSYYEIINYLSHFKIYDLINNETIKKTYKYYFKVELDRKTYFELIDKSIYYRKYYSSLNDKSPSEKIIEWINLNFIEIINIKKRNLELEDFKKEFMKLLVNFNKDDYESFNMILYNKITGIPLFSYLFLISVESIYYLFSEIIEKSNLLSIESIKLVKIQNV